jgi:hypothetical protein
MATAAKQVIHERATQSRYSPSPSPSPTFCRSANPSPSPRHTLRPFHTSAPPPPPLSQRRLQGHALSILPPPAPPLSPVDSINDLLDEVAACELANEYDDAQYDGEHHYPDLPLTPSSDAVLMAPPQPRHQQLVYAPLPPPPLAASRSELDFIFYTQQCEDRASITYNDRDRRPRDRSHDSPLP